MRARTISVLLLLLGLGGELFNATRAPPTAADQAQLWRLRERVAKPSTPVPSWLLAASGGDDPAALERWAARLTTAHAAGSRSSIAPMKPKRSNDGGGSALLYHCAETKVGAGGGRSSRSTAGRRTQGAPDVVQHFARVLRQQTPLKKVCRDCF